MSSEEIDGPSIYQGLLPVLSALHVSSITSAAGEIHIHAGTIDKFKAVSGQFCVKAEEIGLIETIAGHVCLYEGARVSNFKTIAGTVGKCD